jgi:hypothetical protein
MRRIALTSILLYTLTLKLGAQATNPPVASQPAATAGKYPDHNASASTGVLNRRSARSQDLSASIVGAKKLYLVVIPTEKYYQENYGSWLEPRIVGPAGMKKLTELTPAATANDKGPVALDKTMSGLPFVHLGQPITYGFGVKALSVIEFDLPEGYVQFLATISVDSMNPKEQDVKGSMRFKVYTDLPGPASAEPELDAKEKAKAAEEKRKLQQKAKEDLAEGRRRLDRAKDRMEKERARFDEETKRYEDLLKKYPEEKP